MNSLVWIGLAAVASVATAADDRSTTPTGVPPVLRGYEPAESVIFRLPGPPPEPAAPAPIPRKFLTVPPVAAASPASTRLVLASIPALPVVPKPAPPAEFLQEVAFYCQRNVGRWKQADARNLLGAHVRSRPAYDENKAVSGKIYAFRDPTGRYRELELDFDAKTGALRTVFVYPLKLSWQDAHRRWTGEVSAADAQQGRTFYSYAHRRMDVLVDSQGRVISLGLY